MKIKLYLLCILAARLTAQPLEVGRPVHTFSIVARDPQTGEMGVAVQSHWFSVGTTVSWAEAGVGAIATQAMVNVSFGPRGLEMLKSGLSAVEVLHSLLADDDGRNLRQVAIVDKNGKVAAYTGCQCIPMAGHYVGNNFSCQANMMLRSSVWPAMAEAFENATGPLAERMLTALEAAQAEMGDIRGKQSCAILVVRGQSTGKVWEDRLVDLRIEDHPEPLMEMRRLLNLHRAYEDMNRGDLAMEKNDVDGALKYYGAAMARFPDNLEMQYWTAISLANAGRSEAARPMFAQIFSADPNWKELTRRLPGVGMLLVSEKILQEILK